MKGYKVWICKEQKNSQTFQFYSAYEFLTIKNSEILK